MSPPKVTQLKQCKLRQSETTGLALENLTDNETTFRNCEWPQSNSCYPYLSQLEWQCRTTVSANFVVVNCTTIVPSCGRMWPRGPRGARQPPLNLVPLSIAPKPVEAVGLEVEGEAVAGLGHFDDLAVHIEGGGAAEGALLVPLAQFKAAPSVTT